MADIIKQLTPNDAAMLRLLVLTRLTWIEERYSGPERVDHINALKDFAGRSGIDWRELTSKGVAQ